MSEVALARTASPVAETELQLRQLKNRLHARFPTIRSSHLTEAIAAALGFRTQAALRAAKRPPLDLWDLKTFDPEPFRNRLVDFGYEVQPDFRICSSAPAPPPPAHYLEWLRELQELEKTPDRVWSRIYALRQACADEFAKTFSLGRLEDKDDKNVARRWKAGIDHGACLPNWGAIVNFTRGGSVDFLDTAHRRRFYQAMSLANGKVVEYESAMVSIPYVDDTGIPREHEAAAKLAGRLGWTCSVYSEWSWYTSGRTALVLFKRSTPHEAMLKAWEHSFKRWLVENRARLLKSAGATRRKVIEDILDNQHLPMDVADFEDCRERYLKEFAPHLLYEHDQGMVLKRLMEKWAHEQGSSRHDAS